MRKVTLEGGLLTEAAEQQLVFDEEEALAKRVLRTRTAFTLSLSKDKKAPRPSVKQWILFWKFKRKTGNPSQYFPIAFSKNGPIVSGGVLALGQPCFNRSKSSPTSTTRIDAGCEAIPKREV